MPYEFAEIIGRCETLDAVRTAFGAAIAREGYTASACRSIARTAQGTQTHFYFRDCPPDWASYADARKFAAKSIILAEARRRATPFTWLEATTGRTLTAAEQEVWDSARHRGWRNGFVVPVHGPGGYFACVGMDSTEHDLDLGAPARLRLRMMALIAHEHCQALSAAGSKEDLPQGLSPRELECLRWVAAGKTDWEIGMILSISPTTVKFHVDRTRTKLGARTRAQAVARLALGNHA